MVRRLRAILMDFDGVIVESIGLKGDIFAEVFDDHPEFSQRIRQYHKENGGVSRKTKIDHIYEHILKIDRSAEDVKGRIDRFSQIVKRAMFTCPCVDGAEEFLKEHSLRIPIYVVSGTPEDELRDIIRTRGMSGYFAEVLGSPVDKTTHNRNILRHNGWDPGEVLFVGDAKEDYRAARETGLPFVGRVPRGEVNVFEGCDVECLVEDMRELSRFCDSECCFAV